MNMKFSCLQSENTDLPAMFRPFALKMEECRMPSIVINVFKCYYNQLIHGAQGKLRENEIVPVRPEEIPAYEDLDAFVQDGEKALEKAVVIKLNGGLGTSMGLEKAKSLITVKDGLSFLDIILRQTEELRERYGADLPLVFMNSFKTHLDTMIRIEGFDNGETGVPLSFVQHRYPKILENDYRPVTWPQNPELEWNPPGHGDLYTALVTSKLLTTLLTRGYKYAFVSNSDNLGAVMDKRILGYMARNNLPFLMEVAERTHQDRKGGHLARLVKGGRLVLREVAQCPENELESFSDISRHRYFNTNSLWLDLKSLEDVFVYNRMMPLDIIINPKNVDPRDPNSPKALQIETAMGSAISCFRDAMAVRVPRSRFAPVKTTNDLLLVMSDCYLRSDDEVIMPNPQRQGPMPQIDLDPKFFKKIDDFSARFPKGPPSLLGCESLAVKGDVLFEAGVTIQGQVVLENPGKKQTRIPAKSLVEGATRFD